MNWKRAILVAAMTAAASGAAASGSCGDGPLDIVDTAVKAGDFNTLVKALQMAELSDALKSAGPFTVFAPTDAAFAKLPKGELAALLANKAKLAEVLKYHVVPGAVKAADVSKMTSAKTLLGQSVTIDASKGVKVDGANVVATDIRCSNGIIHVIDTVILPKADIIDTAAQAGSFKTLLTAIEAAGLTDTLRGPGPFTVFAPTDEAFAKIPKADLAALLANKAKLAEVLKYHVVSGKVMASDVVKLKEAQTVAGKSVRIDTSNGVKVNDAKVIKTDIPASNGVIHVIDTVIMPS